MKNNKLLKIKIKPLYQHKEHIPAIAQWHQNEWQHISPDQTLESRISLYSSYKNNGAIPSCMLALIDDMPVGTASLVACDLDTMPQYTPWLASVLVHPTFREQGIATLLIEHCIENAKKEGLTTLYLFTPESANFYQQRGWKWLQSDTCHNEHIDIMTFDL